MHTDLAREGLNDAAWGKSGVYPLALDWDRPPRGRVFRRSVEVPEGRGRLIVEWKEEEPAWVEPTLNALAISLALPTNWDSYGARRVDLKAVASAGLALCLVMRSDTTPPTVVPTPEGGVQLEWHAQGIDLEIDFSPTGRRYISCVDRQNETEWEGEFSTDLERLGSVMPRLSHRH